ncbi:hypothetical protein EST38_g14186, partial [Candolleomyces aberdarensis]
MVTATRKRRSEQEPPSAPRAQRRKPSAPATPKRKGKNAEKTRPRATRTKTASLPETSSVVDVVATAPTPQSGSSRPTGGGAPTTEVQSAHLPAQPLGHPGTGGSLLPGQPAFHALAAQMALAAGGAVPSSSFNVDASFLFPNPSSFSRPVNGSQHVMAPAFPYPFPIDPALLGYPATSFPPNSAPQRPTFHVPLSGAAPGSGDVRIPPAPTIYNAEEEEEEEEEDENRDEDGRRGPGEQMELGEQDEHRGDEEPERVGELMGEGVSNEAEG